MNAKIPKIPKKTAEDWEWLERQKATPEWQLIRAGLAKILPDNLSRYVGRGIHVTGYGADSPELSDVPTNWAFHAIRPRNPRPSGHPFHADPAI